MPTNDVEGLSPDDTGAHLIDLSEHGLIAQPADDDDPAAEEDETGRQQPESD